MTRRSSKLTADAASSRMRRILVAIGVIAVTVVVAIVTVLVAGFMAIIGRDRRRW